MKKHKKRNSKKELRRMHRELKITKTELQVALLAEQGETQKELTLKAKAEQEKIALEVKQNKTYWLRKHQWAAVLVPLIIGVGMIVIASRQTAEKTQQATINFEKTVLKHQNDSLNRMVITIKKSLDDSAQVFKIRIGQFQVAAESAKNSKVDVNRQSPSIIAMNNNCDNVCGQGHFSMRGIIDQPTLEDMESWRNLNKALGGLGIADSTIKVSDEEIAIYVSNLSGIPCQAAHF